MTNESTLEVSHLEEVDPLAEYEASFSSDRILVGSMRPHPFRPTKLSKSLRYFTPSRVFSCPQPGFGDGETAFTYNHPPIPPLRLLVPDASIKQLFAHRQWRAGLRMANYIADGTLDLKEHSVLEMGAGTGLPGILSLYKGSRLTVLTDYDDPKLMYFLRKNVSECLSADSAAEYRSRAKVIGHIWGQDVEDLTDASPGGYTRILCADVLWDAFSHPSLIKTLCATLSHSPSARIIVISGLHTGRGPLAAFMRRAAAKGLVVDPDVGVNEYEVGGDVREWDEEREDGDIRVRNRWTVEYWLKWAD